MNAASRAASISALSALVLAAVWLLWPLALGGSTTYVSTHGISMEPRFHTGDMAILRSAGSYAVGDVVAYQSASLDTVVMHRIVALDGDRFVIQGDNNDWLDEDHPTPNEVLGKLFLRVPQGGKALAAVTNPGVLGLVVVAALTVAGAARRPRGRHGARSALRRLRRPSIPRAPAFRMPTRAMARQVALISAAVALLAGVAGGVLLALPSTQTDTKTLQVTQQGTFTYTASAEAGTTYPAGTVSTGDTVWTSLASDLSVSFTNAVTGPDLADLRGAMRLDVAVSSADGWSAYLNSSPVVALAEGSATATVPVDPAEAAALLGKHFAEIGGGGTSATLTVTPVVVTEGTVRGLPFQAGSPAGLSFNLEATSLRLAGDARAALAPSTQTPVVVEETGPRRLSVLSVSIPLDVARIVVVAVFGLSLLTLAGGAWIGRTGRGDVADEFLVKHAARILPVAAFDPGPTVIDVSDPEALHRVAERFDTLVLHHAAPDEDVFAVRDVDATYRLVIPGLPQRQRGKPPVPAPVAARSTEPDDLTAPLPVVVPGPMSAPGGLWGHRFA
ncbi:signal peptidase I [Blastococcus sp. CT_GayMR16]|uniref:signal peptidase I n=1 Tax=Blastococcus sp. CT_GayMR16 TaxID=2559607 RepID=UPI001073CAFB|nr:signal peptidase I [Blastococcus sp. CT_GayMR16]TFV86250.1 signal peptidase I [Blastococcus sp. CT_GayMR16]